MVASSIEGFGYIAKSRFKIFSFIFRGFSLLLLKTKLSKYNQFPLLPENSILNWVFDVALNGLVLNLTHWLSFGTKSK